MAEFECPFNKMMMSSSDEVREVVIRGKRVKVTASASGGDLTQNCALQEINDAKLVFYPGQISQDMTCDRCGRYIKLPKKFIDDLPNEKSSITS